MTDTNEASKGTHLISLLPRWLYSWQEPGSEKNTPCLRESWKKCFNKYIRIIYNWHTLCLNANTAVKVVLKNSLLAFPPYRRNIPLVYTTRSLSKPLFILWCKHNLPNIRSRVSGVWISGILCSLSAAHTNSVKTALESHLCPGLSLLPLLQWGFQRRRKKVGSDTHS